jgi:hypothetical protein
MTSSQKRFATNEAFELLFYRREYIDWVNWKNAQASNKSTDFFVDGSDPHQ